MKSDWLSVPAVFVPEEWVDDYAVSLDAPIAFDAAPALAALPLEALREIVRTAHRIGPDMDALAELTPGLIGSHSGPYTVELEAEAIHPFLRGLGVTDIETLDDPQWAQAQARYHVELGRREAARSAAQLRSGLPAHAPDRSSSEPGL